MTRLKFKNEDASGEASGFPEKFEGSQSNKTFDSNAGVNKNCRERPPQVVRVRPKSASCLRNISAPLLGKSEKRPKSCCPLLMAEEETKRKRGGTAKRLFQVKSVNEADDSNFCQISIDSTLCCCSHECSSRTSHHSRSCELIHGHHRRELRCFCGPLSGHLPKCYCHNIPSFSTDKTVKCSKFFDVTNLWNYKRSLKLLGFQPSDFGIQPRVRSERWTGRKCRPHSSFPTKIVSRSYSLDCLRETIKEAWMEDRINIFHRKILAQAAYEEWYLKKERELLKRQQETKLKEVESKENSEENLKRKGEKAKQEFQKWLQRKKIKLKEKPEFPTKAAIVNRLSRRKSPEETQNAFLKWKKEKDMKLMSLSKEKKREEEMKVEMENQKKEQKILAEKAYQQWKTKMEEKIKLDAKKKSKRKEMQESEEKKKMMREQESQSSFAIWKSIKDEQRQKRIQHNRVVAKLEEEKRQAMLEERLYEADQAFEEWLNQIDMRNEKQYYKSKLQCNKLPWLPP